MTTTEQAPYSEAQIIDSEVSEAAPIGEVNRYLLETSSGGRLLLPLYEAAVTADPTLENVRLVPISADAPENLKIGFARNGFEKEDGIHEVHMYLESGNLDKAITNLDERRTTARIISKKLGIKPEDMTPELLVQFVFLHELGHTSQYSHYNSKPDDYKTITDAAFIKLPIPNMTPRQLRSDEGRTFVAGQWETVKKRLKISSFEELLDMQAKAYRKMPQEVYADEFAARILGKNQTKRKILRGLVSKALKR